MALVSEPGMHQLESLTADVKQAFHMMPKIKQSRHSSPTILVEEKSKELLTLKKYEEQQQQVTSDNVGMGPRSQQVYR